MAAENKSATNEQTVMKGIYLAGVRLIEDHTKAPYVNRTGVTALLFWGIAKELRGEVPARATMFVH